MRRIGFDARLYFQTGVGVYIRNFLHYLQIQAPADYQFYVYVLPKDASSVEFHNSQFVRREVDIKWHTLAEQTRFHTVLNNDQLDVMHFTYFSYPVLYKKKFIATVHDLTPLLFKTGRASTKSPILYELKHKALTYVLASQVKHAASIITPTHAVKDQLIDIYGQQYADKIVPLYEGVNYEFFEVKERPEMQKAFPNPFLLCVGNLYPHKNIERLLDAYKKLNTSVELVLAGPDNYFSAKMKEKAEVDKIEGITIYHPTSVDELAFLYKHALALVNPSLSEGFGLPLVEASYFNTPVIASNIPVFTEIMGSEYCSFDPTSVDDIASKLDMFIQKPQVFDSQKVVERFSFETMTKKYLNLLHTILH